jgi:hypothetical protein
MRDSEGLQDSKVGSECSGKLRNKTLWNRQRGELSAEELEIVIILVYDHSVSGFDAEKSVATNL